MGEKSFNNYNLSLRVLRRIYFVFILFMGKTLYIHVQHYRKWLKICRLLTFTLESILRHITARIQYLGDLRHLTIRIVNFSYDHGPYDLILGHVNVNTWFTTAPRDESLRYHNITAILEQYHCDTTLRASPHLPTISTSLGSLHEE